MIGLEMIELEMTGLEVIGLEMIGSRFDRDVKVFHLVFAESANF